MFFDQRPTLLGGRVRAKPIALPVFDYLGWFHVQRMAKRLLVFVVAIVCLVVGLITLPTPVPVGLILVAVGIGLLVLTSKTVRIWLRQVRVSFPHFDGGLRSVQDHLPRPLQRALRLSAPRRSDKPLPIFVGGVRLPRTLSRVCRPLVTLWSRLVNNRGPLI